MNSKLLVQRRSGELSSADASTPLDTRAIKRDASIESAASSRFTLLSILIPAYNEEATLKVCLEAVLKAPLPRGLKREIILVDDCSTDATWHLAQKLAE